MDSSLSKFKNDFIEEANGLLDRLESDLLALEKRPGDKSLIESVFRAMHTIKGASGMFNFDHITDFTHRMENLYQDIRDEKLKFNKEIFDLTFESVDHIRKLLTDENMDNQENLERNNLLLDHLSHITSSNDPGKNIVPVIKEHESTEPDFHTWHILLYATELILIRGIKLFNVIQELASLGEIEINRIHDLDSAETDNWSILLYTKATEEDISEALLFLEDDCTVVKLTTENILNNRSSIHTASETKEPEESLSILDYIQGAGSNTVLHHTAEKPVHKDQQSHIEKHSIRRISVDASKLDQLMFLVSELITVNSQLNLSTSRNQFGSIKPYLEKIDNLAKQFRNNALEIRLVPLGDTMLRFQRLIRDLSMQLDKKIEFITHGTSTELDKNTIDQLTEPLMHIIRNCIDHGIEPPAIRKQKGKAETGTITLEAYNSGNFVFLKISDDGCGIDDEKVRQKAVDKGYLRATDKPDKNSLYDFIFMPGFSTAQTLTEVSGRGVGMDVVKQRINELRGEITIDSVQHTGTTFTLKLQQSMSIVDSLLFTVDQCFFTVPLTDIAICDQVSNNEIENQRHTSTLPYNSRLIPFVDLRMMFMTGGKNPEKLKSIVIRNNEREMALLCDRIIGEHQAVLKPLGKSFRDQQYITAASQMGDGHMAFMLDTNALFKLCKV